MHINLSGNLARNIITSNVKHNVPASGTSALPTDALLLNIEFSKIDAIR